MELEGIRTRIDEIDRKLVALLSERFALMPAVAAYKKEQGMDIDQPERENNILEEKIALFKEQDFDDEEFVKKLFTLIIEKCKEIQRDS